MLVVQGTDFDKTGTLMTGTLKRLDKLVQYAGGSSHMCLIMLFVVSIFLLLWWLMKK